MAPCCVHWCMTRLLVAWWYVRVVLPTSGCTFIGHLFLWPTVLEEGALLCLTLIHSPWKEASNIQLQSWPIPESVGFSLMTLTSVLAKHGFLDFLDTGRDFQEHFCLGDSFYAHPGNAGPPDPNERKYGILLAAEEVVRAGVLSYVPGSESEHVSPVFTLHRLVHVVRWLVWLLGGFWLLLFGSFWSLTNLCDRVINWWLV